MVESLITNPSSAVANGVAVSTAAPMPVRLVGGVVATTITVGTTLVASGTASGILWNNAGVLASGPALTSAAGIITLPAAGTLAVNGATIGTNALAVAGPSSFLPTGADSPILIGVDAGFTHYGAIAMNGVLTDAGLMGFFGGATGDTTLYFQSPGVMNFRAGGNTIAMSISNSRSVIVGTAAISTSATDGFLYIPTCAGTPTGTPTATTGRVPMIFDTTNSQFWFFAGGAWKQPKTPAGAAIVNWQ